MRNFVGIGQGQRVIVSNMSNIGYKRLFLFEPIFF